MIHEFESGSLKCTCSVASDARVAYVLYPMDILGEWIESASARFNTSIVVITGMDWQNDLTPWWARGVPSGTPDFDGNAPQFLRLLTEMIIPDVERRLSLHPTVRDLVGVSLSGLFTLWQWMVCGMFRSIASLSGSFWYEGFTEWLASRPIPSGKGSAYILLGRKEGESPVPQFRTVTDETQRVVDSLCSKGVLTTFDIVPGNHYQFPIERIERAFTHLYMQ